MKLDMITSVLILILVGLVAWWIMAPSVTAPVTVTEPDVPDIGSQPQGVFSAIRKGEALIDRANKTLDNFETHGVVVRPASSPAVCSQDYSVCRPRTILRRRR